MKLLFINQSLGIGGAETFNNGLLSWLQKQKITVNAHVTNKTFQEKLIKNGVKTKLIPVVVDIIGNWKGFIKGIVLLPLALLFYGSLIIKNKNVDVILMSGFIEKILVTPVAKLLKIPVIWIEFAPLTSIFNKFHKLPKFLYSLVNKLPDKIIVPSDYTMYSLITGTRLSNNIFARIPCGEDIELNNYSYYKTGVKNVCCVSRLEKGKGQDLLLKAWKKVEKEIPKAKLNIVGEGNFLKDLKMVVSNCNLKNVEFKGFVKDSLIEIAKSEIVVFPTVWELEGFGMVAIEAMALSKPVICFNFGPLPEIVNNKTGILIEKENVDKLSKAIIKLLKEKPLGKQLGKEGRNKYLNNFSFNKIGPKYLNVFHSLR